MSYIVMECHPGYAVLLDEMGRFFKAANFHYTVGQTVQRPVLMQAPAPPQRRAVRWVSRSLAAIAACFALFFGLGYARATLQPYSSIYLSINPAVQMDLNRRGTVVALTGTNEDGKALLAGYDGRRKDKVTVADELIDRAIDMGFLSEGGQVSFSIDTPDEALFEAYGTELRTKVTERVDRRITITIEIVNTQTAQTPPPAQSAVPPAASELQPPPKPVASQGTQPGGTQAVSHEADDDDDDHQDDDEDDDENDDDDARDDAQED